MGTSRAKAPDLPGSFAGPTIKKSRISAALGFDWFFARRSILHFTPHLRRERHYATFQEFFQTTTVAVQEDEVTATHLPACEAA